MNERGVITPPSCSSLADCSGGQLCQLDDAASSPQQLCSCVRGRDVCSRLGTCVSFCSLAATQTSLQDLNGGLSTCSPS